MWIKGVYFNPDNGGGSGGGGNPGQGDPPSNTGGGEGGAGDGNPNPNPGEGNANPPKNGGTGEGAPPNNADGGDGKGAKVQFTAEQQKELDRLLAKARNEGKTSAEKKAEEAALKEQGKFKELHETLQTRVTTELEPKAQLADKLTGLVNANIDAQTKEWPDSLKETDPGPENIEERLKWVTKSERLATELLAGRKAPNSEHGQGNNGGSKPATVSTVIGSRYRRPGAGAKA